MRDVQRCDILHSRDGSALQLVENEAMDFPQQDAADCPVDADDRPVT